MIELKHITVSAGDFTLADISLTVPTGAYGILMGATAAGKTTLLESIAGLQTVRDGAIHLGGTDVTQLHPAERDIGYLPQDGALFSKMNVRDHLAFSLEVRGAAKDTIRDRIAELSSLLGIDYLLNRGIRDLSGGEKQRVALGRALSAHPKTLLLDEPLSALDEITRQQMYDLLKNIQARIGVTTLHVTHHIIDAENLGDTFLYLTGGRIQQLDLPSLRNELKNKGGVSPANAD